MQGRKDFTPKMLYQVHLDTLVPADNFYRQLDATLDLHFIYKETKQYYGTEGQESIDPVVFFKIMLVLYNGYRTGQLFLKLNCFLIKIRFMEITE